MRRLHSAFCVSSKWVFRCDKDKTLALRSVWASSNHATVWCFSTRTALHLMFESSKARRTWRRHMQKPSRLYWMQMPGVMSLSTTSESKVQLFLLTLKQACTQQAVFLAKTASDNGQWHRKHKAGASMSIAEIWHHQEASFGIPLMLRSGRVSCQVLQKHS